VGFYIRKALNFGPLRLNFSRSGLGASVGIKSARIGTGPRGRYIHLGRGGLYYRQTLGSSHSERRLNAPLFDQAPATEDPQEIASSSAIAMRDSSSAELLQELNRVQRRWDFAPITAVAGIAITLWALSVYQGWWWWTLSLLCFAGGTIYARHIDVLKGTAILHYSLEDEASQAFGHLKAAFDQLERCQAVWHVDAAGHTSDWKRNAGVNTLTKRSSTRTDSSLPPKVQCNIKVPLLKAGRTRLYFFPDRLLVYNWGGVGAVSYDSLKAEAGQIRFVESGSVPGDATQVGTTWRFVNKKGGPDRRFNNNRQFPVMLYGELLLTSPAGVKELFEMSMPAAAFAVASALSLLSSKTVSRSSAHA
jgi:uncharacterized protein DUF4236